MRAVGGFTREERIEAMLGPVGSRRHGHAQLPQLGRADLDEHRGDGEPSGGQIAQPFSHEVTAREDSKRFRIHKADYRLCLRRRGFLRAIRLRRTRREAF